MAAFLDEELTIPLIRTLIYLGSEGGFVKFRNVEEPDVISGFEENKVFSIHTKETLSEWLLEKHSPQKPKPTEYAYKYD